MASEVYCDPQLLVLRAVVNMIEDETERSWFDTARYKLFEALERDDFEDAKEWLLAVEAWLVSAHLDEDIRKRGRDAAKTILDFLLQEGGK